MIEIKIPFRPYFKNRLLSGEKTATTRTRMYGKPGYQFQAFDARFNLVAVDRLKLGDVAKLFYRHEGFLTPEDFLECWVSIHPKAKLDLEKPVWLHQFALVKTEKREERE